MRPETAVYRSIKNRLSSYAIDLVRIENSAGMAIPDVYFYTPESEGWIEFKYIKSLPKRDDTIVKIPFRPGQVAWLHQRFRMNRNTLGFVLVAIGNEILLFKNENIKESYSKAQLYSHTRITGLLSSRHTLPALYRALL